MSGVEAVLGPGHKTLTILVVAGDVSGDSHSAAVLEALAKRGVATRLIGMGGERLTSLGMEPSASLKDVSVVGIGEAVQLLPRLLRVYRRLVRLMKRERPDLVMLVDYPDMNLRLARRARGLGLKVCYYIVPQVWAWRSRRVRKLKRDVDLSLCLFGFEEPYLQSRGVEARFVGHPLRESGLRRLNPDERDDLRTRLGLERETPVVALMPGSRRSELAHHLDLFLMAGKILQSKQSEIQLVLPLAPGLEEARLTEAVQRSGARVKVLPGKSREVLQVSDIALLKSGTSTVEAALCGTPMVIGYRVSRASYWLARMLVRSPYIGMANLLGGDGAFPELIQDDLTPGNLADAGMHLLREPTAAAVFDRIRTNLGAPGSADRAAAMIEERFFRGALARPDDGSGRKALISK